MPVGSSTARIIRHQHNLCGIPVKPDVITLPYFFARMIPQEQCHAITSVIDQ